MSLVSPSEKYLVGEYSYDEVVALIRSGAINLNDYAIVPAKCSDPNKVETCSFYVYCAKCLAQKTAKVYDVPFEVALTAAREIFYLADPRARDAWVESLEKRDKFGEIYLEFVSGEYKGRWRRIELPRDELAKRFNLPSDAEYDVYVTEDGWLVAVPKDGKFLALVQQPITLSCGSEWCDKVNKLVTEDPEKYWRAFVEGGTIGIISAALGSEPVKLAEAGGLEVLRIGDAIVVAKNGEAVWIADIGQGAVLPGAPKELNDELRKLAREDRWARELGLLEASNAWILYTDEGFRKLSEELKKRGIEVKSVEDFLQLYNSCASGASDKNTCDKISEAIASAREEFLRKAGLDPRFLDKMLIEAVERAGEKVYEGVNIEAYEIGGKTYVVTNDGRVLTLTDKPLYEKPTRPKIGEGESPEEASKEMLRYYVELAYHEAYESMSDRDKLMLRLKTLDASLCKEESERCSKLFADLGKELFEAASRKLAEIAEKNGAKVADRVYLLPGGVVVAVDEKTGLASVNTLGEYLKLSETMNRLIGHALLEAAKKDGLDASSREAVRSSMVAELEKVLGSREAAIDMADKLLAYVNQLIDSAKKLAEENGVDVRTVLASMASIYLASAEAIRSKVDEIYELAVKGELDRAAEELSKLLSTREAKIGGGVAEVVGEALEEAGYVEPNRCLEAKLARTLSNIYNTNVRKILVDPNTGAVVAITDAGIVRLGDEVVERFRKSGGTILELYEKLGVPINPLTVLLAMYFQSSEDALKRIFSAVTGVEMERVVKVNIGGSEALVPIPEKLSRFIGCRGDYTCDKLDEAWEKLPIEEKIRILTDEKELSRFLESNGIPVRLGIDIGSISTLARYLFENIAGFATDFANAVARGDLRKVGELSLGAIIGALMGPILFVPTIMSLIPIGPIQGIGQRWLEAFARGVEATFRSENILRGVIWGGSLIDVGAIASQPILARLASKVEGIAVLNLRTFPGGRIVELLEKEVKTHPTRLVEAPIINAAEEVRRSLLTMLSRVAEGLADPGARRLVEELSEKIRRMSPRELLEKLPEIKAEVADKLGIKLGELPTARTWVIQGGAATRLIRLAQEMGIGERDLYAAIASGDLRQILDELEKIAKRFEPVAKALEIGIDEIVSRLKAAGKTELAERIEEAYRMAGIDPTGTFAKLQRLAIATDPEVLRALGLQAGDVVSKLHDFVTGMTRFAFGEAVYKALPTAIVKEAKPAVIVPGREAAELLRLIGEKLGESSLAEFDVGARYVRLGDVLARIRKALEDYAKKIGKTISVGESIEELARAARELGLVDVADALESLRSLAVPGLEAVLDLSRAGIDRPIPALLLQRGDEASILARLRGRGGLTVVRVESPLTGESALLVVWPRHRWASSVMEPMLALGWIYAVIGEAVEEALKRLARRLLRRVGVGKERAAKIELEAIVEEPPKPRPRAKAEEVPRPSKPFRPSESAKPSEAGKPRPEEARPTSGERVEVVVRPREEEIEARPRTEEVKVEESREAAQVLVKPSEEATPAGISEEAVDLYSLPEHLRPTASILRLMAPNLLAIATSLESYAQGLEGEAREVVARLSELARRVAQDVLSGRINPRDVEELVKLLPKAEQHVPSPEILDVFRSFTDLAKRVLFDRLRRYASVEETRLPGPSGGRRTPGIRAPRLELRTTPVEAEPSLGQPQPPSEQPSEVKPSSPGVSIPVEPVATNIIEPQWTPPSVEASQPVGTVATSAVGGGGELRPMPVPGTTPPPILPPPPPPPPAIRVPASAGRGSRFQIGRLPKVREILVF